MLCLAKRWAENHSVSVETAMLKSRTHAKYRPQPVLLAALLVGLLLSLQTSAADTARQGTQSTALYLAVRNILSTGTTVTGEPIRYPSGAPALITAVEISRRELGNHQHFPDDHGAITAVPDRNRASFPARHARRFEPR